MPDGWIRVQDYEEYLSIENDPPSLYQNNQYYTQKRKQSTMKTQVVNLKEQATPNRCDELSPEEIRRIRAEERERKMIEREDRMNKFALWGAGVILIVIAALVLFVHFIIWITPGLNWYLIMQNLVFGLLQGLYYLFKSFYWLCETVFNYIFIDLIGFQF